MVHKASSNKTSVHHASSTVEATTRGKKSESIVAFCRSLKNTPVVGASIAEFIGTFLLVAFTLSLTISGGPIMVAFALVGIVLMVGAVSGAHLNPAITIGAWVTKKISSLRALGYIMAQALGGAAAYAILNAFFTGTKAAESAASAGGPALLHAATLVEKKEIYVFFAELIGVMILSFGIATALRNIKKDRAVGALTAGFTMLAALTIAGSLTYMLLTEQYTSYVFLNPVVATIANVFNGFQLSNIWPLAIYVVAPIIGGILGFVLQDFLHSQTERE